LLQRVKTLGGSADHYDAITSLSGKICNDSPKLTGKEDPAVITVADFAIDKKLIITEFSYTTQIIAS